MWIFWVHASNKARFTQAYQNIALQIDLPARNDPQANILQLVREWLENKMPNRRWLIVLDNVDDIDVFLQSGKSSTTSANKNGNVFRPLSHYIPRLPNGLVLITSRNKLAAIKLTDSKESVIEVLPFDKADSKFLLFRKLIDNNFPERDLRDLVA